MAALGSPRLRRSRLITLLSTVGVIAVIAGGALVTINVVDVSGAATPTTLKLTTAAPGTSCNNSNPSAPICSGLAAGETVNVSGTGFAPGALASIVQCSSEVTQPVILFLGNDIPVSCSPLALVTIPSKGKAKGTLTGTRILTTGTVGPPVASQPTTCTQVLPSTSVITGCTTSTDGPTDAARFPCPPTPAQQAAGDTCVLAIGDQAGDRAIGIILFGTETLPTSTTATTGGSSTTSGATTSTTSPTSTSTATQVSAPSITLGPSASVSDSVTVRGSPTHGSPTGNVNFYVCRTGTTNALTPGPCPPAANVHLSTAHLTAGANNASSTSSGSFVPTAAGTWCFSAVYGGDSIYTGSADNTGAPNLDAKECVLVNPAASTTATFISSVNVVLGPSSAAIDTVTVTGNVVGGPPTGGVSFYMCHTSLTGTLAPGPCPATGTPEDASVPLLSGAGATSAAASKPFVATSVGTWCFSAVYGGNSTYAPSSDNTSASNADAGECVLVAPPAGNAITSDPNVSASAGTLFSFTVTTSGSPTPSVKKKGKLPKGVHFVNNHNGTATLSGTPNIKKGPGVYQLTITATFGKGKAKQVVTQAMTLTVT